LIYRKLAKKLPVSGKPGKAGKDVCPMRTIDEGREKVYQPGGEGGGQGTGRTVLLMDDEESILEAFGNLLSMKGFRVLTARNGNEALSLYRTAMDDRKPIDVVILDLTIPDGMGGIDTMRELKQMDPGVCALISSGMPQGIVDRYASCGFAGTIPKPYRWGDLILAIDEALRRK
jgi:two-component system, cell cycle sensor histidine kinase and response regulator CckA